MNLTHRLFFSFLFLVCLSTVHGFTSDYKTVRIGEFDATTIGNVTIDPISDVVSFSNSAHSSLIIDSGGSTHGSAKFVPISIEVGNSFYSNITDEFGMVVTSVRFQQTSETTTEVHLDLSKSIDLIESEEITFFAKNDLGISKHITVPKTNSVFVGTVTSPNNAWIASKYWYCEAGECLLVYDPEETFISFSSRPDVEYPFKELGIILSFPTDKTPRITKVTLGPEAAF